MSETTTVRTIALTMLGDAHKQRNDAEWRLWQARDEVTRLRLLLLEAQQREATAQRDLDRDQEFLSMLWSDVKPLASQPAAAEQEPA